MTISFKYMDSFDTEATTANKSMGFDPSTINLVAKLSQVKAPAGLSSIIITVGHPAIRPSSHLENYNFQARAMLDSSLARWELF